MCNYCNFEHNIDQEHNIQTKSGRIFKQKSKHIVIFITFSHCIYIYFCKFLPKIIRCFQQWLFSVRTTY